MCIKKEQEDTENWKCCGCLSLTVATLLIGALELIGCISALSVGLWAEGAIYGLFTIPYVFVIIDSKSTCIRKTVF